MKSIFAQIIFTIVLITSLKAQSSTNYHIETDPMTTMFGAKTISLVLENDNIKHWSVFANVVTADFPNWMDEILNPANKGKGFDSRIKIGGGLSVDYFLDSKNQGWYVGWIHLVFNYQVQKDGIGKNLLALNTIPRVGYRYFFTKK